jgi:hypothetical protein
MDCSQQWSLVLDEGQMPSRTLPVLGASVPRLRGFTPTRPTMAEPLSTLAYLQLSPRGRPTEERAYSSLPTRPQTEKLRSDKPNPNPDKPSKKLPTPHLKPSPPTIASVLQCDLPQRRLP